MNYKLLALVPMIAAGALIKNNKQLKVTNYNLEFHNLPEEFHNFKIAQVSDIHCDKVGISDLFFLEKLCKFSPDIIVITGDILDSYRNDMDIVYNILSQLSTVAPCYFVTGNHELRLPKEFEELKNMFERLNISYLHNEIRSIYKTNDKINLIGIEDYNYFKAKDELNHRENFQNILSKLSDKNEFNILLSHRPEKFDFYVKEKYNLVFSGHAHGGQWQIPFVGGIFSLSTYMVCMKKKTQNLSFLKALEIVLFQLE